MQDNLHQIELKIATGQTPVDVFQTVFRTLGLAVEHLPGPQDPGHIHLHQRCNAFCDRACQVFPRPTKPDFNLLPRSACMHRFHSFCLKLHYLWSKVHSYSLNSDRVRLSIPSTEMSRSWRVPANYCPICDPARSTWLERIRPILAHPDIEQFLMCEVGVANPSVVALRPHFHEAHLDVLALASRPGDVLDVGGCRFRHAVILDQERKWRRLEFHSPSDEALIPHEFWTLRGRDFYENVAMAFGKKVLFCGLDGKPLTETKQGIDAKQETDSWLLVKS